MTTSEFIDHVVALDCAQVPADLHPEERGTALHTLQQGATR